MVLVDRLVAARTTDGLGQRTTVLAGGSRTRADERLDRAVFSLSTEGGSA